MWRKGLSYTATLVTGSFINKDSSQPYYKGAYVVNTLRGAKIVLIFSQVSSSAAKVMYKLFNDDGSSASTSGNPVTISHSDLKVSGVVH